MTEPLDLTDSQAEALVVLRHCEENLDDLRDFAYSSTTNDLDHRCIASGSAQVLEDLGLARGHQHGISMTWVYRLTDAGRELAGRLCRIHEPGDPACGEVEEVCPR